MTPMTASRTTATPVLAPPTPTKSRNTNPLVPDECYPDVELLVTEDHVPVDNVFHEKQQRLLTESLFTSWSGPGEGRPFLAMADVGYYFAYNQPPIVPDVLVSLDATYYTAGTEKERDSYFQWLIGKPPDIVIEVVSRSPGGEGDVKLRAYAAQRIAYYVIHDPTNKLGQGVLRAFSYVAAGDYIPLDPGFLPGVGLGFKLWKGTYEKLEATWLRWCDAEGNLIPTGAEGTNLERAKADTERAKAKASEKKAQAATTKAKAAEKKAKEAEAESARLAAKLRKLGIDPDE